MVGGLWGPLAAWVLAGRLASRFPAWVAAVGDGGCGADADGGGVGGGRRGSRSFRF